MKQRLLNPQAARRVIAGLLLLFMILPMMAQGQSPVIWSGNVADQIANKNGATGKEGSPILIENGEELAYLAQQVKEQGDLTLGNGNTISYSKETGSSGFRDIHFALDADIDLAGYNWTPIGINDHRFSGNFDGKGHCVSGLSVGYGSEQYIHAGLFGNVENGTIQNLGVRLAENGGIRGSGYAGGIVGYIDISQKNTSEIRNCYVEGPGRVISTRDNNNAGGIAGYTGRSNTTLSHCYATVDVEASGNNANNVGGIVGYGTGNISYTYATGSIQASGTGNNKVGGICGFVNGNTTLSNNLALNKEIKVGGSLIHRIAGDVSPINSILTNNYASPDILINGKPVSSQKADGWDGSETGIDLTNYANTLKNDAPADAPNEWNSGAWVFDTNGILLPQLRMMTGKDDSGKPTYEAWPSSIPQPQLRAGNHMGVAKIENDGGGDGDSWAEAIQISNSAELAYLAKQVNAGKDITVGNTSMDHKGKHFILTDNIDLSAYHWVPIGKYANNFCGHFDGNGYCVSGLSVGYGSNQYDYAGLFGYVRNGTIQNLGVRLAKDGIWGSFCAGGIVGRIYGERISLAAIRNCYVEGPGLVKATGSNYSYAGGIVGYIDSYSSLSHCYSTVNVEASSAVDQLPLNYAGGIAGGCYNSSLSHTYATSNIKAAGGEKNSAGGICGYANYDASLSNNLALNKEIEGDTGFTSRVTAEKANTTDKPALANNYASPDILINDSPVNNKETNSSDGSDDIHTKDYEKALKTDVNGDNKQPWVFGGTTHLPKLRMVEGKNPDGSLNYVNWPNDNQPTLSPLKNLPVKFILHIVAPNGGSVTVKDGANNDITHGTFVLPGTTLTLSHSDNDNYEFVGFLSGTGQNSLSNCDATLTMPKSELWVSAQFKEKPKPEPETPDPPYVPIYYTVMIPSVEGATTDPGPGDHEVESWSTFRFYLTLDTAYSDSQPVVTTSRGETLTPRTSDGAYLVKYVRTDVEVFIDGILPNHPTANAAIEADALRIYALGSTLVIYAPHTAEAMLCDLSGRLLDTYQLAPGQTRIEGLRAGIYIVKVPGAEGVKVVIR